MNKTEEVKTTKEELQVERKELTEKWDALEKQLIELIAQKGNEKLMDLFLDWQNIRSNLNANFFKIIEACTPNEEDKKNRINELEEENSKLKMTIRRLQPRRLVDED